ncbi:MAG: NAD(P)/FAD-dependent oxidoreductase [Myxococcota bacterium]
MTSHVVVLGGGFGGLAAARALSGSGTRVTLIDRRNHHLFQPLLYQVATASLAPSDIAEPIRSILSRDTHVTVRLAEATEIDRAGKRVCVRAVEGASEAPEWVSYDYLVIALGVQQSWFGHASWEQHAPGLKTLRDALEIRRRILMAFERAEWAATEEERRRLLTFVVVGGGPTGVELAGAIAEIALTTFRRDFRNIDTRNARVALVEASPHVLASYPEHLRVRAREQLEELGVEVLLNAPVSEVDEAGVMVNGERIETDNVLWAAGVQAPPLTKTLGVETDRAGRLHVQPDGSLPGHPEIFAVGDIAHLDTGEGPLPGVAPVALGMGKHAAACILADLAKRERTPYRYTDRGQMATIGRRRAVLQSGRFEATGTFAWLAWVFVHLMVLVTYRNRLVVFIKWAWAWLTYERASRLIWQTEKPPPIG